MKRISVTYRRSEMIIVRGGQASGMLGVCDRCRVNVSLLSLDSAVTYLSRNTRELIRLIEDGSVHSVETASGHLLVCQNSLEEFIYGETK